MGLSIVAEAARRLHGIATLRRGAASGSVVLVSVPLAARRQTLLLVEAGDALFGLPDDAVERLLLVDAAQVVRPDGRPLLRVVEAGAEAGGLAPVAWLAALLGRPGDGTSAADGRLSGALLAVSGRRCLLVVERLRDVRTLLVRAPDLVGIDRRLVAGLATDGEGRPVLVLEPARAAGGAAGRAAACGGARSRRTPRHGPRRRRPSWSSTIRSPHARWRRPSCRRRVIA